MSVEFIGTVMEVVVSVALSFYLAVVLGHLTVLVLVTAVAVGDAHLQVVDVTFAWTEQVGGGSDLQLHQIHQIIDAIVCAATLLALIRASLHSPSGASPCRVVGFVFTVIGLLATHACVFVTVHNSAHLIVMTFVDMVQAPREDVIVAVVTTVVARDIGGSSYWSKVDLA